MVYEWAEAKRIANLDYHGLDFRDAPGFDWERAFVIRDRRRDYGEERYIAYGKLLDRVTVIVFTPRDATIRIISWRKANSREVKRYESAIKD